MTKKSARPEGEVEIEKRKKRGKIKKKKEKESGKNIKNERESARINCERH